MESWNSPDTEKESPSLEKIAHIKRDGESLEDFEDITKDEPSMKDLTAQFLQYETGDRSKLQKEEYIFQDDTQLETEQVNSDYLVEYPSNKRMNEELKDFDNLHSSEYSPKISGREDSFKNLCDFEQSDLQNRIENIGEELEEKPVLNILNENKLIDTVSNDEISTGSDDLPFIPKKAESYPVFPEIEKDVIKKSPLEYKSNDTIELSFNSQPLSKFTSEPGLIDEQEPETLQGDGLHVKKINENDISDNDDDDFVPEPIPKDYPEIGVLEGKHILALMGLGSWFRPDLLHPKVESLIYWRNPKKSGIVFGSLLIILLSLTSFSLISVVAYTSLYVLFAAAAFKTYKGVMQAVQKTSDGHPFKEYLDIDLTVNPDKAREISDVVVSHLNKGLVECRRLFLIEDIIDSAKFGILLWSMTYIGAWFNGLSLIIIAFVGLFTLPKVYENNKPQIDANVNVVKTKINEVTEKITAIIPLGKKTEEAKDKSE